MAPVVQSIRRQVEGIPANLDFKMSPKAAQALGGISQEVVATTEQLRGMTRIAGNLGDAIGKIKFGPDTNVGTAEFRKQVKAAIGDLKRLDDSISGVKSQSELAGEVFGSTARRLGLFIVAAKAFQVVSSGLSEATSKALAFQNEMVRLSQIGGTSAGAISAVSTEITRLATNLGTSSQDLSEVAVTLRQAGLSADETKTALEALAKTTLAPTFESLKNTTEGVIAMRQQFDVSSEDIAKRLGSINTVAGEFAVESEDLVTAIRKAGGAFKSASGDMVSSEQSFNQLLALFTSVRNTTRESADEIATGLRTIFARVQSTSVSNSLKEMGINLRYTREESRDFGRDVTGQFVGAYEAVRRLSAATQDLPTTDPRYSQIVEQLGGFRQISRVIPLLQQFGTAQKAYTVAQAGANSLTTDAAKAQDSFLVKLTKVKEEFFDLIRTLSGNKTFQTMIDQFLNLTQGALSLAKHLEPIVPLITTIAAVKIGSSLISAGKGALGQIAEFRGAASLNRRKEQIDPTLIRRRGGGVIPGHGTGDKVPLLAEPGEFVLNRKASKSIGYAALAKWNGGGYDRRETPKFANGGQTKFPIITEPGEYFFDRQAVTRIGLSKLQAANRTGKLPIDPRERLATKINEIGGMRATLRGFATGGQIKKGDNPDVRRIFPYSTPLLQPLDPRERLALKLKAMGRLGDAWKDRPKFATGGLTQTPSTRVLDWDRIRKLRDLEQGVNGEAPMKVDGFSRLRRRFEMDPDTKQPTARAKYYATSRSARYALGRGFPIPDKVKKLLGRATGGSTDDIEKKLLDLKALLGEFHDDIAPQLQGETFANRKGGGAQKIARQLDVVNKNIQGTGDPVEVLLDQISSQVDPQALENLRRQINGGMVKGGRLGTDKTTGKARSVQKQGLLREAGISGSDLAVRLKMVERAAKVQHEKIKNTKADEDKQADESYPIGEDKGPKYQTNAELQHLNRSKAAGTDSKAIHQDYDFSGGEGRFATSTDIDDLLDAKLQAEEFNKTNTKSFDPTSRSVVDYEKLKTTQYEKPEDVRSKSSLGLSGRLGRASKSIPTNIDVARSSVVAPQAKKIVPDVIPAEQAPIAWRGYHYGPNNPTLPEIPDHIKNPGSYPYPLDLSEDTPHVQTSRVAQEPERVTPSLNLKRVKSATPTVTKAASPVEVPQMVTVGPQTVAAPTNKPVPLKRKSKHTPNVSFAPEDLVGVASKPIQPVVKATEDRVRDQTQKASKQTSHIPSSPDDGSASPINTGGRGPRLPRKTASGGAEGELPSWVDKLIASLNKLEKAVTASAKINDQTTRSPLIVPPTTPRKRRGPRTNNLKNTQTVEISHTPTGPLALTDDRPQLALEYTPSRTPIPLSPPGPPRDPNKIDSYGHPTMTENDLFELHDGLAAPIPRKAAPRRENEPRYQRLREFYAGQVATSDRDRTPERQTKLTDRLASRGFRNATDIKNDEATTLLPRFKKDYLEPLKTATSVVGRLGGRTARGVVNRIPTGLSEFMGDLKTAAKSIAAEMSGALKTSTSRTSDRFRSTASRFTIDPEITRDVKAFLSRATTSAKSGTSNVSQVVRRYYDLASKTIGDVSSRTVDAAKQHVSSYVKSASKGIGEVARESRIFTESVQGRYKRAVDSLKTSTDQVVAPLRALGERARDAVPIAIKEVGNRTAPIQRGFRAVSGVASQIPGVISSRFGPSSDIGKVVGRYTRTAINTAGTASRSPLGRKVGSLANSTLNLVGLGTTREDNLRDFYEKRINNGNRDRTPEQTSRLTDYLVGRDARRQMKPPTPTISYRAGSVAGSIYRGGAATTRGVAGFVGRGVGFANRLGQTNIPVPFRSMMGPDGVTPATRGERFNRIANLGAVGVYGTTVAASYLQDAYGGDTNDVESLQRNKRQTAVAGGVTGAALGAQIGMMAPVPGGAVIGGVIGTIVGFGTSLAGVDKQIKTIRLDKSLQGLARAIDDVVSGRIEAGSAAQAVNKRVTGVREEVASQTAGTGGNFFNNFSHFLENWTPGPVGSSLNKLGNTATNIGLSATSGVASVFGVGFDHDSNTSVFGRSAQDRAKSQFAAQQSKEQELLGPMLPQLRQSMELLAGSIKLNDKDLNTTSGGDPEARRSQRAELLNQNGGRELMQTIARVEKVPINQVVREFDATLTRTNKSRLKDENANNSTNDSDLQARRFERLGSALDAAALSLKRFHTAADAIETLAQGQAGTAAISGVSEQAGNLGGIDDQRVKNTTTFARTSLGDVGSGIVEQYTKTIEEIDRVKRELPGLLTKASKGSDFSEQNIIGDVSKAFDGFSPDIQKKLETKLNSMDAKTVTQDLTTNPEKFAQTLTDPFKEAESVWTGIIKQLEDAPQKFAGDLGRASLLQNQTGATRDRASEAGLGVVQARTQLGNAITGQNTQVGLNDLVQPFNARQTRLAGTATNPFDADSISTQLRTVQKKALEQGERANNVELSGGDRKQAQIEFTRLTSESANLQKALEHLGDTSSRLSAIQTKIAEAEKVRNSQLSLTERLLTGDTSSKIDFHRGVAGANIAGQQGNFAGFSPENIKLTLDALRAFGDIKFTEGPLKGFTGSGAAEKLLANSSGGLHEGLDANAQQRQIIGLHGNALGVQEEGLKATKALGDLQETLANKFFKKINDGFDRFFLDADKRLAQADVKDKQTNVDTATAKLAQTQAQAETAKKVTSDFGSLSNARSIASSPDLAELSQNQADLGRLTKIVQPGGVFTGAEQEIQKSGTVFGKPILPPNELQDRTDPTQREAFLTGEQERLAKFRPDISAKSGLSSQEVDAGLVDYLGKLRSHVEPGGGAENGRDFSVQDEFLESLKKSASDSQRQSLDATNSKTASLSQSVYGNTNSLNLGRIQKAASNPFDLGETLKTVPQDIKSSDAAQQASNIQNDRLTASNEALRKANEKLAQIMEKVGGKPVEATAVVHKAAGGSIFKPRGSDTVPAMLTPGEFVVKADQAKANRQALHAINNGTGPVYKADGGTISNIAYWKKIEQDEIAGEQARAAKNDAEFRRLTKGRTLARSTPYAAPKIDLKQHVANYDKQHAETLSANHAALKAHIGNYDDNHDVAVATSEFALVAAKDKDAKRVAANYKSLKIDDRHFGPSADTLARVSEERVRHYKKSPEFVGPRQTTTPIPDLENIGFGIEAAPPVRRPARHYRQEYTPRSLPVPASEKARRSRRKYRPTDSYSTEDNRNVGNQIDAYLSQYLMGFADGGMVPKGTDSVPTMLTKGEYVVDRQTASAHLPLLQKLKPEYRASGGSIGNTQANESNTPTRSDQVLVALPAKLTASFSLLAKAIEPLAELPKSFTEFGRSQKELGTSLAAWSASATSLGQAMTPFVDSAAKLAQALSNTSIPSEIKVSTNNKVEVLINGAQVLASIKGDLGEVVMQAVMAKLPSAVKAIIAEMPG